jgi:hypothetical protein
LTACLQSNNTDPPKFFRVVEFSGPWHIACSACPSIQLSEEQEMLNTAQDNSKSIVIDDKALPAAKCEECGAKMYPRSLLRPHVTRHQRRQRWFMKELSKLKDTMAHMRDIA